MEDNSIIKNQTIHNARDVGIDFLRVIGLLLVFLAHTYLKNDSSSVVFNIRSFDVVAMVFASGLAFSKTRKSLDSLKDYYLYLKKRFFRLIVPCWIFISIYIIFSFLINYVIPNENCNVKIILLSYSMISGIGYVWIVRVFFCIAIVAPFLKKISEGIQNQYINILIVFSFGVLISFVCYYSSVLTGWSNIIVNLLIMQFISYSLVYYLAICYAKMEKKHKIFLLVCLIILTVVFCTISGFSIDNYKNPPSYLYLTYGVTCSIAIYEVSSFYVKKHNFGENNGFKLINWISKECFLLYFIHIFFVFFVDHHLLTSFIIIQYIIILVGSILIAVVIYLIKNIIKKKIIVNSSKNKELLK